MTRASVSPSPSEPVAYRPIGAVASPVREPLRPELIRSMEARLVLEARFAPAWDARCIDELFRRRIACRSNPIGVTLVRVVGTQGSTVTVIGLDALDGSPILDVKPSQAVFDAPPVEPGAQER